jgi:hypothetical protein
LALLDVIVNLQSKEVSRLFGVKSSDCSKFQRKSGPLLAAHSIAITIVSIKAPSKHSPTSVLVAEWLTSLTFASKKSMAVHSS